MGAVVERNRLLQELAAFCEAHPIDEKILLVPSFAVGTQILDALARSGCAHLNLRPATPFSLALTGTVVSATDTTLTLTVSQLQAFPMNLTLKKLTQQLTLTVPSTSTVQENSSQASSLRLLGAYQGEPVVVWTQPALATTKAMLGVDGALTAALVQLG